MGRAYYAPSKIGVCLIISVLVSKLSLFNLA